jgi:maltose/maltodextrin transport system permease protein
VSVGLQHYRTVLTEPRFGEPFLSVLAWTIVFSALTVAGATALGLLLAVLFNWETPQLKGV